MARKRKSASVPTITVKVGRTGGRIEEYALEGDEPTVGEALEAAGISTSKGDRIRADGDVVDRDTIAEDGQIIMVSGKVAGAKVSN